MSPPLGLMLWEERADSALDLSWARLILDTKKDLVMLAAQSIPHVWQKQIKAPEQRVLYAFCSFSEVEVHS